MIYLLIAVITLIFTPSPIQVDGTPELNYDYHILNYSEWCTGAYTEIITPHNSAPDGIIYTILQTDAKIICWKGMSVDKAGNESNWSEESQYKEVNVQIGRKDN